MYSRGLIQFQMIKAMVLCYQRGDENNFISVISGILPLTDSNLQEKLVFLVKIDALIFGWLNVVYIQLNNFNSNFGCIIEVKRASLCCSPGARFRVNDRARKTVFSSSLSKNGEVYTLENFCMKRASVHINNM